MLYVICKIYVEIPPVHTYKREEDGENRKTSEAKYRDVIKGMLKAYRATHHPSCYQKNSV